MRDKTGHDKKITFCNRNCGTIFSQKDNLQCHMSFRSCPECHEIFCTKYERKVHIEEKHASISKVKQDFHFNPYRDQVMHHKRENAFDVFSTATFDCCEDTELDIFAFLNDLRLSIENELKYQLHEKKGFKCSLMLEVFLTSTFDKKSIDDFTSCLDPNNVAIYNKDEVSEYIDIAFGEIIASLVTAFEEF